MYYKDQQGALHWLDDVAFKFLLPDGSVAASSTDVASIKLEQSRSHGQQSDKAFIGLVQWRLDSFAGTRGYDSILSACTYAASAVAKFRAEGQACVNLRDATWAAVYKILDDVRDGKRSMPTSIAEVENDLPKAAWPADSGQ